MTATPVVQLFVNPASGGYSARRITALTRAFEAGGARTLVSEASALSPPEIAAEATHVCVVGGDGTVRHVAAALAASGRRLPLTQYPAGTINLLSRETGAPKHAGRFAARVLTAARRSHYGATVGDQPFLYCVSVGPEGEAVERVSAALKRRIGRFAYAAAFLRTAIAWPRPALQVRADGQTVACEAVYVAKGRFFAGPWSFAPRADLTDGLLHVVALRRARRRDYALFVLDMLLARDPGRRNGVAAFACTELTIDGPAGLAVQGDGDIVARLPVTIRVDSEPHEFC